MVTFDYSQIYVLDGQIICDEVGCGCCGNTYGLSKKELLEYIDYLKDNIKKLEEIAANSIGE